MADYNYDTQTSPVEVCPGANANGDDVINALLEEYDGVDRATVEQDFDNFTEQLKGANILE